MPLKLDQIQKYRRVPGTMEMQLTGVSTVVRVKSGGNPPLFIQDGKVWDEGGREIMRKNIPAWFWDELRKMNPLVLAEAGISQREIPGVGEDFQESADVTMGIHGDTAHRSPVEYNPAEGAHKDSGNVQSAGYTAPVRPTELSTYEQVERAGKEEGLTPTQLSQRRGQASPPPLGTGPTLAQQAAGDTDPASPQARQGGVTRIRDDGSEEVVNADQDRQPESGQRLNEAAANRNRGGEPSEAQRKADELARKRAQEEARAAHEKQAEADRTNKTTLRNDTTRPDGQRASQSGTRTGKGDDKGS